MSSPPEDTGTRNRAARHLLLVGLLLGSILFGACRGADGHDLLEQAETLCRDAQWQEAKVLLKKYLIRHPDDAAGHFYLGRCYLFLNDFRPALAEGEIQTALSLFLQNGKKSPIERFTADYFEMMCYIESAKVCLIEIETLQSYGARVWQLRPIIDRCKRYAKLARELKPNAEEVRILEDVLSRIEGRRPSKRDTSSPGAETISISRVTTRVFAVPVTFCPQCKITDLFEPFAPTQKGELG